MTTGGHEWDRTARESRLPLVALGLGLGLLLLLVLLVVLVIGIPLGDAAPSPGPTRSGAPPAPVPGRAVGGVVVAIGLLVGAVRLIRTTDWDLGD